MTSSTGADLPVPDPIGDAAVEAYKRGGTCQHPVLTVNGELSPEREAMIRKAANRGTYRFDLGALDADSR